MHTGMKPLYVLTAAVALLAPAGCVGPRVTTKSLLSEMTDLGRLAEFPDPAYTCKQASSYDRKSVTPDDHDAWFANADCGQFIRVEECEGRTEYVMMDADGPGAIVRFWSANPRGVLRFYLDGSAKPTFEVKMSELLGGEYPGIPKPIACEVSKGWNSYFPIPYAKHCKVTGDEILVMENGKAKARVYYHINYRTYPAGTRVESFKPEQIQQLIPAIDQVAAALTAPRVCGVEPSGALSTMLEKKAYEKWIEMSPGSAFRWRTPTEQAGAIVDLRFRLQAADVDAALREIVLTGAFDGQATVCSPLGDFFGAAPGINAYESLPMGMTAEGELWSHWVMPFEKNASINLANHGRQNVRVQFYVAGKDNPWTERSMHFHAKWRAEYAVPTRPMIDWNYLNTTGQGRFVGVAFNIANPVKNWWGEGDEKIYVDGETFPSHFGTGTEDYYGYAWCWPHVFTHAYHNQPRVDGPGNYGHTAVNRWHILDDIPFQHDLKFDMELWHWHATTKVDMAVVSYWYARPSGTDSFPPINPADLRVPVVPPYAPPRVAGALEGEELAVLEVTGGTHEVQELDGLSNENHRWWHYGKPGDKLTLGFDVDKAGKYRVLARFVTAGDYGTFQLYVNDAQAGETHDFYCPRIKYTDEIDLGTFELAAGQNKLTAEITGKNEQAVPSYMFGLDYLRLEVVE